MSGTYIFESTSNNLTADDVRKIIRTAGVNTKHPDIYDPALYTMKVESTRRVDATGPGDMATTPLEDAGRELGWKKITVDYVPASAAIGGLVMPNLFGPRPRTLGNLLGATGYKVTIAMSQDTVQGLSTGGYFLYAFKGVQTTVGGGSPLVWFRTDKYGLATDVDWKIQYQAFTSRSQIVPNGTIGGLSPYDIDLGQKLEVTTPQGTGDVVDGASGMISIENLTSTKMTCGISEVVAGSAQPLCAFPLYGNNMNVMVPIQKVLLCFSTNVINTGTVIEQSYSQSILIDLTSATSRDVSYDINEGWKWGGFSWAKKIRPDESLVPLLIESDA